ncbi:MAG: C10 family peptidase [Bacteroidales bacterium]|nr:C10 family peptidase [Bacteroidales bacterium]
MGDSHYWVCEGAKETTEPGIQFFTENQPYGAGTLGGAVYLSFYMNWGWGGSYDGWFASNNVDSGNGNFQYSRQNIYIEEP